MSTRGLVFMASAYDRAPATKGKVSNSILCLATGLFILLLGLKDRYNYPPQNFMRHGVNQRPHVLQPLEACCWRAGAESNNIWATLVPYNRKIYG